MDKRRRRRRCRAWLPAAGRLAGYCWLSALARAADCTPATWLSPGPVEFRRCRVAAAVRRPRRLAGRAAAQRGSRLLLPRLQRRLSRGRRTATRACVGKLLAFQRRGARALRRPARPDLLRLHHHAQRVHPESGHGLLDGQRAASRFGVDGATQEVMRQPTNRAQHPGVKHATGHRGPIVRCSTPSAPTSARCSSI